MQKAHVLLVDDEKDFIDVVKERLALDGYTVTACYGAEEAIQAVHDQAYDVVVIDLIMQDADGITAMHRMKLVRPIIECIVLSGQGTLRMAVEAMKQGAFEFLEKPCDHRMVAQTIDAAFARKHEHEKRILRAAKKVYSRLEQAMVDATFAQAGQLKPKKEVSPKKV